MADNLEPIKKRSKAIKSRLPCFSCCCPYHGDKISINCKFSTYGIKRIQEFNQSNSIHIKFVITLTKAYHSLKPIKMTYIQNQKQARKLRQEKTLLSKRCFSLLLKILNSDDVFKNWNTHTQKKTLKFAVCF